MIKYDHNAHMFILLIKPYSYMSETTPARKNGILTDGTNVEAYSTQLVTFDVYFTVT